MTRREEDYETSTVDGAAGFEAFHADGDDDRVLDARDARRDFLEDEQERARAYVRRVMREPNEWLADRSAAEQDGW
jgi:hypothetical protein